MSLASRACVATYGLAALLTGLSARLYYLAVHEHDHLAALARENYEDRESIPARRGNILAANGKVLAQNEPLKNVIVDDSLLHQWDEQAKAKKPKREARLAAAKILAAALNKTPEQILTLIKPDSKYTIIEKKISEDVASTLLAQLTAARIKGIRFEQDFERIYPADNFLCHVLGFYGWEQQIDPDTKKDLGSKKGVAGIELAMENWLAGQPGWRYFERDGHGREMASYRGEERSPRHGADVRLTIDPGVQQIVESELDRAFKELKPKKATVIIMEPYSGEILALANRPCYDPNNPGIGDAGHRNNHAISSVYEPGSTFKAVSAAGAINRGLVSEVWCRNGVWVYPGGRLTDHHPYGMLSVEDVIAKSSNIGAVTLAKRIGEPQFYDLVRSFGFGSRTGITLPGESQGILHPLHKWGPGSMYHIPFGHEVAATPLQVINATCAIANGGTLMMPHIIREIRAADGALLADYPPQEVRRVIKAETAQKMTLAFEKVTSRVGTALRARVPGFRVAGKTGTTQIFDKELGRYSKEDHTLSFVGYLPADKPRFCCLVMIEDSAVVNGRLDSAGLLAAPVFSRIAERTAMQLGLEPDPQLVEEEMELRKALVKGGPPVNLESLAKAITPLSVIGSLDRDITAVCYDSRAVVEGAAFVALPGEKVDGADFIDTAIDRGAAAVISERAGFQTRATHIQVANARQTLADLAAAFYRNPSHQLKIAAVTGTNGKTTTAFLIKHILDTELLRCGLIGTVRYVVGDRELPASRTTPESADLHELLWQMRSAGSKACAMEVSSHAIIQDRVRGVEFDVAAFSNLSQDHLDFHGTMERYFDAKAQLFDQLAAQKKKKACAAVNIDDRFGARLVERIRKNLEVFTFGQGSQAHFRASSVRMDFTGTNYALDALGRSYLVRMPLIGGFNVYNSLAAITTAHALGVPVRNSVKALANAPAVPGRLQPVPGKRPFRVFVDYAHTDDALSNVMRTLRDLQPARLIVVFGCGGNRDRAKRPLMAAAVDALADHAIVTSDNPRREDPLAIIEDIKPGFRRLAPEIIPDRKEAIFKAIAMAGQRDIILLAGKGHETYQEFADATVPFDDVAIASTALDDRRESITRSQPRLPQADRDERRGLPRNRSEDEAFD